jgi:hypothetical protein
MKKNPILMTRKACQKEMKKNPILITRKTCHLG